MKRKPLRDLCSIVLMIGMLLISCATLEGLVEEIPTETRPDPTTEFGDVHAEPTETVIAALTSNTPGPTFTVTIKTPVPPTVQATDTPELLLDHADFLSVVRWVSYSISHNQPEMIADLIGEHGTRFAPFAVGAEPTGYNNADEVVAELRRGLTGASPECLGYNENFGSRPDRAIIFLRGINIDWVSLGIPEPDNDVITFQFFNIDGNWDLIYITTMLDYFWDGYQATMLECP